MKIPDGAKRVFKGELFDVYQWEQKMFDGSFATFERVKRPDTVQVIAIEGDKIIVCEEEQPDRPKSNSLLGGRVEKGETPLESAKRELKEESGYESDDWELWRKYSPDSKIMWDIYVYIARNCKRTGDPVLDPGEKIKLKKVGMDGFFEVMDSPLYAGTEIAYHILTMRLKDGETEEFKRKLFKWDT